MKSIRQLLPATLWLLLLGVLPSLATETKHGAVVTEHLASVTLRDTRTGLDPDRIVKIYLPPSYTDSSKSYPVIYYCHSIFFSAEKVFADGNMVKLLEQGFTDRTVPEFIFVVADYTSPTIGSLYENAPATGRWLDFTAEELVPFIDTHYRTLRSRDSRGVAGEVMGGRGAFELAMHYPDLFSVVYAMHPVATGLGLLPLPTYPNWQKIHQAKAFSDLQGEPFSQIFLSICQAFVPNPNRPPFYCDFPMEMKDGQPVLNPENTLKLKRAFLLDHQLDEYAANLRRMRGIAFDWSRYDPVQDHVYGCQAFSRILESYGIEHEAEEYRGIYWTDQWTKDGRFARRLLPFFARHLVFQSD